jgi:tyrosyl-DNA phosphodiesterase 2
VDVLHLPPWRFDDSKQEWDIAGVTAPKWREELTFATFNVWFEEHEFTARSDAMFALLRRSGADVIALQEVIPRFLDRLLKLDWVRREFAVSDATGATIPDYGVVLLSRLPVRRFEFHDLPTTMSRKLLLGRLESGPLELSVGTVHLESLKEFGLYREEQLQRIFGILEPCKNTVLLGDFNFCSMSEENARIDDRYADLWPLAHPDAPGWTVDGEANGMRQALGKSGKQVRFDRILVRSERGVFKLMSINLLGADPISPERPDVYPSDHFGLVATLELGMSSRLGS